MNFKCLKPIQLLLGLSAMCLFALPATAQRAARPQVDLPGGEVRNVILNHCISCHGIDDYAFHAMDKNGWQTLINTIHKEQRGLQISSQDEALLVDYLQENFGADSIPFPRDYVVQEIDEFFNDDSARVFLERSCTSCHELDRVFNVRYTPDRWRAVVVADRARGAELSDESLERLVEWLGRVRGTNPVE